MMLVTWADCLGLLEWLAFILELVQVTLTGVKRSGQKDARGYKVLAPNLCLNYI